MKQIHSVNFDWIVCLFANIESKSSQQQAQTKLHLKHSESEMKCEKSHYIETNRISKEANLKPRQIRLPSPNGIVLNGCRLALASFEKRLGSNCMGLGKRSGSREKARAGMITAVSFGKIDPFGNR